MLEFIGQHFQTILIFLIAIAAVYIAYQQHLTNKHRFNLALFEKRIAIYYPVRDFLLSYQRDLKVDFEQLREMRRRVLGADILFGKKVVELNQEIIDMAVEYMTVQDTLQDVENLTEEERLTALNTEKRLTLRLVAAAERANEAYKPYFKFSRSK